MHCSLLVLTLVCLSDILWLFIILGDQYSLECLNDYISTINCSLNISAESPGNEQPYWLQFFMPEHYNCTLERRQQSLICVLDLPSEFIFTDSDSYSISLHSGYHGNNFSVVLDGEYMPSHHIRPVAPCNLSLFWKEDGAVVQWLSRYDPESHEELIKNLQYQLRISSEHSGTYEVTIVGQNVSVEKSRFKPHTNYTMRVRSKPNEDYYKGVWSPWTPALHWRSGNINGSPGGSFHIAKYLVIVPISLVLLICISCSRCRKQEYIPSPAPYLKDWKTDAKPRAPHMPGPYALSHPFPPTYDAPANDTQTHIHTLLSGKVRDIIQGEEFLQIDIITENENAPPQQTTFDYETIERTNEHEPALFPSMLHSSEGSEVDSGCWIRDVMATERGRVTCIEDYCTLSHSQHTYSI